MYSRWRTPWSSSAQRTSNFIVLLLRRAYSERMRFHWFAWAFCLICAVESALFSQDKRPVVFEFGAAAGVPFNAVFGTMQPAGVEQSVTQNLYRPKIIAGPVID